MKQPGNLDPVLTLGDGGDGCGDGGDGCGDGGDGCGDGGDGCGDGGDGSNLKKGCEKRVYSIRNMSHSVNVYRMRWYIVTHP